MSSVRLPEEGEWLVTLSKSSRREQFFRVFIALLPMICHWTPKLQAKTRKRIPAGRQWESKERTGAKEIWFAMWNGDWIVRLWIILMANNRTDRACRTGNGQSIQWGFQFEISSLDQLAQFNCRDSLRREISRILCFGTSVQLSPFFNFLSTQIFCLSFELCRL